MEPVEIKWTKDELVGYVSNLSAFVAQTLSLDGSVAFDINTLTNDNRETFLNEEISEAVSQLIPHFSRIINNDAEVINDDNIGFNFTPRIEGGSYSKAELSHIKTLSRKLVASYILADWYTVKGVASMSNYFATQYSQTGVELNRVLDGFVRPTRKAGIHINRVTYSTKPSQNLVHINNKSDFVLVWSPKDGSALSNGEFDIDFFTDGDVVYSVNSLDAQYVKPIEGENDKVRIIFDFSREGVSHFANGILKYNMYGDTEDSDFPDGKRHYEISGETNLEIWSGASDTDGDMLASYVPLYAKLTFEDLTEEDIEQLQAPANEAAERANEAAERANKIADGIQDDLVKKADIDKSYPKMTAGFAQEIVGDGSATPEEFSFRPTAGEDRNVANTTYYEGERNGVARIEKIKGNSVVANNCMGNQINQKGYFLTRYEDGSFLVKRNPEVTSGRYFSDLFAQNTKFTNHKYAIIIHYIAYNIVDGGHIYIDFYNLTNKQYGPQIRQNGEGITITIVTCDNTSTNRPVISYGPDGEEEILIKSRYAIDLTKMFGAGKEPTTVEEFYQRLPKGIDISEYNDGTIIDGNYGSIKTVGFNAFNGTYAKVCAGCSYYLGGNYTSLGFTTEEGGTLEAITIPTSAESVGTTPSDRFYTPLQNGYIYAEGENININISWGTEYGYLNGTYQPYKPFERDLSWVSKYFPATINGETKYGMRRAGSERDEIRFNFTTQKWEAVQNVGVRAYAEGDSEDTSVTTDGTNTNYALATPIVTEISEDVNLDFDVSDYGTEELIVAEGAQSAPLVADIIYAPNALSTIKQVPDILKRLKALEGAVASATATTNEETVE